MSNDLKEKEKEVTKLEKELEGKSRQGCFVRSQGVDHHFLEGRGKFCYGEGCC